MGLFFSKRWVSFHKTTRIFFEGVSHPSFFVLNSTFFPRFRLFRAFGLGVLILFLIPFLFAFFFFLGFVWWLLFCVYFCSEDSVANDYRFLARRRADANQSSDFLYSSVVSLPSKIQISLMSCPSFILLRITRFM